MGHSNLVQVKKNKITKRLSNLSEQHQGAIVDLAIKKMTSTKGYQHEEKLKLEQRKQNMAQKNVKRRSIKEKNYKIRKKSYCDCILLQHQKSLKKLLNIESEKIMLSKRNKNYTFEDTN